MVKTCVYTINHILLTFGAITTQKKSSLGLVVLIFSTELGERIPDSSVNPKSQSEIIIVRILWSKHVSTLLTIYCSHLEQ